MGDFILSLPARDNVIFRKGQAAACPFLKITSSTEQRQDKVHPKDGGAYFLKKNSHGKILEHYSRFIHGILELFN